jgi:hypothetical protein
MLNKLLPVLFLSSLSVNIAWAADTNSLGQAALDIQASHATSEVSTPTQYYQHSQQQNNSLARAVLAKQGVEPKVVITSTNQISYQQYNPGDEHNSLLRAVLAKHYKETEHLQKK